MKITPFLTSANKAMDYRVVSAARDVIPFARNARTDANEPIEGIVYREVRGPDGVLHFYSRKKPAGDQYIDGFGRPIIRTDGICVTNDPEGRFVFHQDYLSEAERINDRYFEKFWPSTDESMGAIHVHEEIPFCAGMPEHTVKITHLEPYEVPKKNPPAAATASEDGPQSSKKNGSKGGGYTEGKAGAARAGGHKRVTFRASSVALGVIGIGLIANGALVAFSPSERPANSGDQASHSDWHRPLRALVEVGLGAGLTWAAFVQARRGANTGRLPGSVNIG